MVEDFRVDIEKIDAIALVLLSFTAHRPVKNGPPVCWKGLDWNVMGRLYEKGWVSDPKTKAKSAVLSE